MKSIKKIFMIVVLILFTSCFNNKENQMAESALNIQGVKNTTLEFYIYKSADKDKRISSGENLDNMLMSAMTNKDYVNQLNEYLNTGKLPYKIKYEIIGKRNDGTVIVKYKCLDTQVIVPIIPDGDFVSFYPNEIEIITSDGKSLKPLANNGPFGAFNIYAY